MKRTHWLNRHCLLGQIASLNRSSKLSTCTNAAIEASTGGNWARPSFSASCTHRVQRPENSQSCIQVTPGRLDLKEKIRVHWGYTDVGEVADSSLKIDCFASPSVDQGTCKTAMALLINGICSADTASLTAGDSKCSDGNASSCLPALLQKHAFRMVCHLQLEEGFYSRYFLVPKRDGDLRGGDG
ncbi:UNVERIFIED_CONTAM: hypothetical protein FKN15_046172 [Acipenser sinensis]